MAQDATTGSISGTITDKSGAAVRGATVTLTNTDRNHVERTLTTNGNGFYTATALPLGSYDVTVSDAGFKTTKVQHLMLHVADALTVNRALSNGENTETVTVNADEARVNLEDASGAGLINSDQINSLVMISRNYESLINLQPGVAYGGATDNLQRGPVGVGGASSTVSFSVNGGRTTSNNWTVDGADNVDRGANLTLYVYPSPDAIAEFKTLRGQYSAQYGRNSSGMVDVVTKSGTNKWHGSAYEYFRNDFLDANGYYNDQIGQPINKYRYNDFGGSFGGPVWIPKLYNGRDKSFFFVSLEALREVTYATLSAIVPTAAERRGDFSQSYYIPTGSTQWTRGPVQVCTAFTYSAANQTNTCTAAGTQVTAFSQQSQQYLKDVYPSIPLPNEAANLARNIDPHTISNTVRNVYNNLNTTIRGDHQIGTKLSLMYRYIHDTFPTFNGSGTFISAPIPGLSATQSKYPGTQHLGKVTYLPTPTSVINVGYAYSNGSILTQPQGKLLSANSPDVQPTLPYGSTVGVVPTISMTGMTSITSGPVYVDHGINHQGFADYTKTLHNHTLIAGFSYMHYEKQENNSSTSNQGSFGFTNDAAFPVVTGTGQAQLSGVPESQSFANFLTGNANSGFSQQSRNAAVDINQNIYEAYLQDNWKVTPHLTLNLGVRYSYVMQPYDAGGNLSNFDPSSYSASKAPTIASTGLMCLTGTCSQAGSNAGQSTAPNANADFVGPNYINGMIFGNPSAANNNQASPFGNKVTGAQKNNFAPRVGFAWDVFGDGKTALRGGYGWAYDEIEVSYYETTVFNNPPAVATYSQTMASADNPAGGATATTPSTTPGRIQALPLNFKTPYMQQFSLGVQQQITPTLLLDVAYVGSHGTHLAGAEEINQPRAGAWRGVVTPTSASSTCVLNGQPAFLNSTCDRVLNQIKPYLGYFAVDAMQTIFNSNYNSLQTKVTKRFKGKSFIDGNFTWSRDLTNAQADYSGFVQDIYNVNGDYGRAAVDRKLLLTLDGVWELPWYKEQHGLKGRLIGGWNVAVTYAVNSGLPLTVAASGGSVINYNLPGGINGLNGSTTGGTVNDNAGLSLLGNTNAGLRPNQIADPNQGYGVNLHASKKYGQSSTPWFYTGAFTATDPASNVPGTARRGTINGPGFQRADLGIFRVYRIVDGLKFQLRGEAFNVANHTNIQSIGVTSTSSTFGQVTGYRDARILQVAGRFDF
ncbi:carboxypeptidase regulatory-like domain-containing protein [Granulicella cerasi]|nr:carboxypeptidase regulatory-like domain-containing protein [Granulicella cerasi]